MGGVQGYDSGIGRAGLSKGSLPSQRRFEPVMRKIAGESRSLYLVPSMTIW